MGGGGVVCVPCKRYVLELHVRPGVSLFSSSTDRSATCGLHARMQIFRCPSSGLVILLTTAKHHHVLCSASHRALLPCCVAVAAAVVYHRRSNPAAARAGRDSGCSYYFFSSCKSRRCRCFTRTAASSCTASAESPVALSSAEGLRRRHVVWPLCCSAASGDGYFLLSPTGSGCSCPRAAFLLLAAGRGGRAREEWMMQ